MLEAVFFSILADMASGPFALVSSRLTNSLKTSSLHRRSGGHLSGSRSSDTIQSGRDDSCSSGVLKQDIC